MDTVYKSVTIALSGTLSTACKMPGDFYLAGLIMPVMTTSTAVKFRVSTDGVTYYPLYDGAGAIYSITIDPAVAEAIAVDPSKFYPWEYVKVEVADAQAAARTIGTLVREY